MTDELTMTHLSYLVGEQADVKIGDEVTTLCGERRAVIPPNDLDVCGKCFKVFAEDAFRTGDAVDVMLNVISGITDVLNTGRESYIKTVGDGDSVILTGKSTYLKNKQEE